MRMSACAGRRQAAKTIPRDPPSNHKRTYPTNTERLAQWNALAVEFADLWTRCWSGKRVRVTLEASCDAMNSVRWRVIDMTWALTDPRSDRPDEAGDHVRALRLAVERLHAALEFDATRRRRVDAVLSAAAPDLRLPRALDAVRKDWFRDT
jgi:hypothetical protein